MRLTVLVDNNASVNLAGEWGLSIFIEVAKDKILFDLGASDLFLRNAKYLNLDVMNIDYIILSHGHFDHARGLDYWLQQCVSIPRREKERPVFLAHPSALKPKFAANLSENGMLTSVEVIDRCLEKRLSREPVRITEQLFFLGEIERRYEIADNYSGKTVGRDGTLIDDPLMDDTALAYKAPEGLVIIAGCSHSGIINIVEQARRICDKERVLDIIGGFHLFEREVDEKRLDETISYLKDLNLQQIHPCHCTSLLPKLALAHVCELQEVKVGTVLEFE
jgi:7,8-dihydropterin-6-yl-methyl-4-(beta-D-ribofuranosyl)aminobenzene 5'-phosphate synthase